MHREQIGWGADAESGVILSKGASAGGAGAVEGDSEIAIGPESGSPG